MLVLCAEKVSQRIVKCGVISCGSAEKEMQACFVHSIFSVTFNLNYDDIGLTFSLEQAGISSLMLL